MIKRYFFLFILVLTIDQVQAQSDELTLANQRRLQVTRIGMLTLGGWAVGNMGVSGTLMGRTSGSQFYFHQMNVFWNVVNITLAGFGYYNAATAAPSGFTLAQTIQEQHSLEKLLLLNAGLDVAYVTAGFYLLERSKQESARADRWKGYGQSLLLQGGFLLIFDAILYAVIQQSNSKLLTLLSSVQISPSGLGLIHHF